MLASDSSQRCATVSRLRPASPSVARGMPSVRAGPSAELCLVPHFYPCPISPADASHICSAWTCADGSPGCTHLTLSPHCTVGDLGCGVTDGLRPALFFRWIWNTVNVSRTVELTLRALCGNWTTISRAPGGLGTLPSSTQAAQPVARPTCVRIAARANSGVTALPRLWVCRYMFVYRPTAQESTVQSTRRRGR